MLAEAKADKLDRIRIAEEKEGLLRGLRIRRRPQGTPFNNQWRVNP